MMHKKMTKRQKKMIDEEEDDDEAGAVDCLTRSADSPAGAGPIRCISKKLCS